MDTSDQPTTRIHGSTVLLRALERADLPPLRSFANDPEVMRFSNTFRPISDEQQEAWWERTSRAADATWFGIEDIRSGRGKLVGTCCLVDIDWVSRVAELRILIGAKEAWGHGLGTEACGLLVAFGFEHLNLGRIWLRALGSNGRAVHMCEKLGFVTEGKLRRGAFIQGATEDVVIMGLLREEWAEKNPNAVSQPRAPR
jgi:RimJ/RimL family protein N-acetyltransferase